MGTHCILNHTVVLQLVYHKTLVKQLLRIWPTPRSIHLWLPQYGGAPHWRALYTLYHFHQSKHFFQISITKNVVFNWMLLLLSFTPSFSFYLSLSIKKYANLQIKVWSPLDSRTSFERFIIAEKCLRLPHEHLPQKRNKIMEDDEAIWNTWFARGLSALSWCSTFVFRDLCVICYAYV